MLTFILGLIVGIALMVCRNRITQFKDRIVEVIDKEMKRKP